MNFSAPLDGLICYQKNAFFPSYKAYPQRSTGDDALLRQVQQNLLFCCPYWNIICVLARDGTRKMLIGGKFDTSRSLKKQKQKCIFILSSHEMFLSFCSLVTTRSLILSMTSVFWALSQELWRNYMIENPQRTYHKFVHCREYQLQWSGSSIRRWCSRKNHSHGF